MGTSFYVLVVLSEDVLRGLLEGARNSYPREFFCLLGGRVLGDRVIIDEIIFIPYRSSPASAVFRIDDVPVMDRVVGSAHSHPARSGISKEDVRTFPRTGVVHALLLPPFAGKEDVRFYDARGREVPWVLGGQRASF